MESLTISDLDDGLIERLRVRAAMAGHSMEDEACEILRRALCEDEVAGGKISFVKSIAVLRGWAALICRKFLVARIVILRISVVPNSSRMIDRHT